MKYTCECADQSFHVRLIFFKDISIMGPIRAPVELRTAGYGSVAVMQTQTRLSPTIMSSTKVLGRVRGSSPSKHSQSLDLQVLQDEIRVITLDVPA